MLLLHISDIHFRAPDCVNPDFDAERPYRTRLIQDVRARTDTLGPVGAILIGGDIAFHGHPQEYEAAFDWIEELANACGCPLVRVFVIPGNHDVDRDVITCSPSTRNAQLAITQALPQQRERELRTQFSDPETGRFLSEDPIHFAGLDVNLYRYVFNNPVNLTDPTGQILPAIIGAGCIAGAIGGVIGGFDGTVAGAITAITISEAQSGGGGGGGSSNDGCGDADSTEPPPAIPTPTPGDFLRNAAVDALLGCLAGATAVFVVNPATVFTAAAIASSVGATEGFIMGFVGQIKQLF